MNTVLVQLKDNPGQPSSDFFQELVRYGLDGNQFVFSIRMTQAKNPVQNGSFGLWFGSDNHEAIKRRLSSVLEFVQQYSLNKELFFLAR